MIARCLECRAELAVPDARWWIEHENDGSHTSCVAPLDPVKSHEVKVGVILASCSCGWACDGRTVAGAVAAAARHAAATRSEGQES